MVVSLFWLRPHLGTLGSLAAGAHVAALVSLFALALSAVLQTSVVDPNRDFMHPAVQGGWLLYIAALFPALSIAMTVLGVGVLKRLRRVGAALVLIGLTALAPIIAASLHALSPGSLAWDIGVAVVNGLFGSPGWG